MKVRVTRGHEVSGECREELQVHWTPVSDVKRGCVQSDEAPALVGGARNGQGGREKCSEQKGAL